MKNQQRLIALLAILVTILAYAAFAATTADTQNQTPPPPPQGPTDGLGGPGGPGMRDAGQRPGGPGFMLPLQALDLTSDQKDAVKAILEANRQASQATDGGNSFGLSPVAGVIGSHVSGIVLAMPFIRAKPQAAVGAHARFSRSIFEAQRLWSWSESPLWHD